MGHDQPYAKESIPAGDDLSVGKGLHSFFSDLKQFLLNVIKESLILPDQVNSPFKVSRFMNRFIGVREPCKLSRRKCYGKILVPPGIAQSFCAMGVCIVGAVVPSLMFKGLCKAGKYFFCCFFVSHVPEGVISQAINPKKHCLVIKHFFKMGYSPFAVNRVAEKSPLQV